MIADSSSPENSISCLSNHNSQHKASNDSAIFNGLDSACNSVASDGNHDN